MINYRNSAKFMIKGVIANLTKMLLNSRLLILPEEKIEVRKAIKLLEDIIKDWSKRY